MLTLKELINRCLAKDKAAWSEFVLKFKAIVEKSIRARFRHHNFPYTIEDIKDITQSIFLDIWEKNRLELIKNEDKINGWIAIVAQNATIDFIRSSKKLLRQTSGFLDEEDNPKDTADMIISASNPLKELVNNELADILDTLIGALEPRDRLILKLNILHGLSHREISGLLKLSINTVSTIIRRCLLKLRASLEKRGYKNI